MQATTEAAVWNSDDCPQTTVSLLCSLKRCSRNYLPKNAYRLRIHKTDYMDEKCSLVKRTVSYIPVGFDGLCSIVVYSSVLLKTERGMWHGSRVIILSLIMSQKRLFCTTHKLRCISWHRNKSPPPLHLLSAKKRSIVLLVVQHVEILSIMSRVDVDDDDDPARRHGRRRSTLIIIPR